MSRFKTATDEVYEFYKSFIESGFTREQAFKLVSLYMHRSIIEDLINRNLKRTDSEKLREKIKDFKEYTNKELKEKENDLG